MAVALPTARMDIEISTEQAVSIMMAEEEGYVILDVRTAEEFADRHIPNEEIGPEGIPALGDKQQLIFVYCRSGNRSKHPQIG